MFVYSVLSCPLFVFCPFVFSITFLATMHFCFACQTSPLCTFAFHAIHHYAPLVFMHFSYPSPLRTFSFWDVFPSATMNTSSQGRPLSIPHLPPRGRLLSIPHHYELSFPGSNSIYSSPLRTLPPRVELHLSLTTTNSPSQGRTQSIPHHYELSLPGSNSIHYEFSLPMVNSVYPTALNPRSGELYCTNSFTVYVLSVMFILAHM